MNAKILTLCAAGIIATAFIAKDVYSADLLDDIWADEETEELAESEDKVSSKSDNSAKKSNSENKSVKTTVQNAAPQTNTDRSVHTSVSDNTDAGAKDRSSPVKGPVNGHGDPVFYEDSERRIISVGGDPHKGVYQDPQNNRYNERSYKPVLKCNGLNEKECVDTYYDRKYYYEHLNH